jgi:hypothetical protein
MNTDRPGLARLAAAGWFGVGALLVTRPGLVLAAAGQSARPPALVLITRVLGARTALQNAVVLAVPARPVVRAGAAVDTLHALSMLGAALRWPAYRRAALASGSLAAAAAASATASLGRASMPLT